MGDWYVQVVETATGLVEHEVHCWNEDGAKKIEKSLSRFMNTDRYHTNIIDKDSTND